MIRTTAILKEYAMSRLPSINRSACILLAAMFAGTLATEGAQAADQLRWKFKAGDNMHYQMVQDTQMRTASADRTAKTAIAQTIDLTWKVTSVDAKGVASMTQTIDRMRIKATTQEGTMAVDSASNKNEGPLAQSMAPIFKALIGAPFVMKMTPTGRIRDVEIPASAVEALKTSPELGSMLSADSLKEMTAQAAIPLPEEPVDVGASWTDEKVLAGVNLKMTYTYGGPVKRDGKRLGKIATSADLEMTFPETDGVKAEMEKGELTGEMFFDYATGKLLDSSAKQNMAISIVGMDQSIRQEVQSLVNMRLVPPGEKERPAEAAPATETEK